jgi:acyl-CoA reductase-like NAD-dependent aldehyde dehydrogenase
MSPSKTTPSVSFTEFSNIVDGKLRGGKTSYNGTNPVTGDKLWDVPVATEADLDDAVKAARRAFPSWSKTPIEERKRLVKKWNEVYQSYEKEFTDLIVKECGKPRMFANMEVKETTNFILHHSMPPPVLPLQQSLTASSNSGHADRNIRGRWKGVCD